MIVKYELSCADCINIGNQEATRSEKQSDRCLFQAARKFYLWPTFKINFECCTSWHFSRSFRLRVTWYLQGSDVYRRTSSENQVIIDTASARLPATFLRLSTASMRIGLRTGCYVWINDVTSSDKRWLTDCVEVTPLTSQCTVAGNKCHSSIFPCRMNYSSLQRAVAAYCRLFGSLNAFTPRSIRRKLAVDMDIHGYIHGYYAGTTL